MRLRSCEDNEPCKPTVFETDAADTSITEGKGSHVDSNRTPELQIQRRYGV